MELSRSSSASSSASTSAGVASPESESESLSAIACSCMLSLVVAQGDTGQLLTAITSMLMFSSKLASQHIKVIHLRVITLNVQVEKVKTFLGSCIDLMMALILVCHIMSDIISDLTI